MNNTVDISNYIDITLSMNHTPQRSRFSPYPLMFLTNTSIAGRGQYVFLSSPDEINLYPADLATKDFVTNFFSGRDKNGRLPRGIFLASGNTAETEAVLYSGVLPDSPAGLPSGVSLVGNVELAFDGKVYKLPVGIETDKKWTDFASELQTSLTSALKSTAFSGAKVQWLADQKRLLITAGVKGDHQIVPAPNIDENGVNAVLGFSKRSVPVFGGKAAQFSDVVINLMKELKQKTALVAWDKFAQKPEDLNLKAIVNSNEHNDLFNILCFSSNNVEQKTEDVTSLEKVAFCYDPSPVVNGVYPSLTTAMVLAQIVSATNLSSKAPLSSFDRYPTSVSAGVFSDRKYKDLKLVDANFISQVGVAGREVQLFEGGKVWHSQTMPGSVKTIYGESWLRYNIQEAAMNWFTQANSVTTSQEDQAKLYSIVSGITEEAKALGIVASASGMSKETVAMLPQEVLQGLNSRDYYLKVYPKVDFVPANDGSGRQFKVYTLVYELYYFSGNEVSLIKGYHETIA